MNYRSPAGLPSPWKKKRNKDPNASDCNTVTIGTEQELVKRDPVEMMKEI